MNKLLDRPGFVVFSDSIDYEIDILGRYFSLDSVPENIVFVYSTKDDMSAVYAEKLSVFNKQVLLIPFESYNKIEYASQVESLDLSKTVMIIKDLRFMLKRLDERLSMMQIKHTCYKKIVIDRVPFVVDMWKLYFPYSFFDKTLLGYSHSYAYEASIRNYEDDPTLPDPCDAVDLSLKIKQATFINYFRFFDFDLVYETHKVTEDQRRRYEELKGNLFETENSIKSIISKLHKYAKSLVLGYNVPVKLNDLYDWVGCGTKTIYRTDLKVDDYLCRQIDRLVSFTNTLVSELYGN